MKTEIICVMCVYNEERNIQYCLDDLKEYVDSFVVYDDGSTDNTLKILENCDKVKKIIYSNNNTENRKWKERSNRELVLRTALEVSESKKPWVLCIDPDERCELRFKKKIRKITEKYNGQNKLIYLHLRELWDNINQYRCDGIWNKKKVGILFQLSDHMTFNYDQEYHIPWAYREILNNPVEIEYNIYHLKMIREDEREKRKDLYNSLDPQKEMQSIGYDYLVDKTNLKLQRISFFKRYEYSLIPNYYMQM